MWMSVLQDTNVMPMPGVIIPKGRTLVYVRQGILETEETVQVIARIYLLGCWYTFRTFVT